MSETEYLAFERASQIKHESFAGEVFAMSAASSAHNLICASVSFLLYSQLRGRPCELYPGDMRVQVAAAGLYTYPDLSVVCGEAQFADAHNDTLLNPTVIIEVLSPTTEGYDRGRKFQRYRALALAEVYERVTFESGDEASQ